MQIERRGFLEKALAMGVGAMAMARGIKAYARGLPSDPDTPRTETAGSDVIVLSPFEKDNPFALDKALVMRKSSRNYDADGSISQRQLSRLLWAANGVNRQNGHRTTPSAVARYPVEVLATLPAGAYRYETAEHRLVRVLSQDIRREIPRQPGLKKAAMILLYLINKKKVPGGDIRFADIEIGCMVQNTYLQATSLGLGSCVFAIVRYENVGGLLGLDDNKIIRIAQAVGPLRD